MRVERRTQTIEATGKPWKAAQAIGGLVMIVGGSLAVAGFLEAATARTAAYGLVAAVLLGAPVYAVGRLGAWWFHG